MRSRLSRALVDILSKATIGIVLNLGDFMSSIDGNDRLTVVSNFGKRAHSE